MCGPTGSVSYLRNILTMIFDINTRTNVKLFFFLTLFGEAATGCHNRVGELMIHSFTTIPSGNILRLPQAWNTSTTPTQNPFIYMIIFVSVYRTAMLKE